MKDEERNWVRLTVWVGIDKDSGIDSNEDGAFTVLSDAIDTLNEQDDFIAHSLSENGGF